MNFITNFNAILLLCAAIGNSVAWANPHPRKIYFATASKIKSCSLAFTNPSTVNQTLAIKMYAVAHSYSENGNTITSTTGATTAAYDSGLTLAAGETKSITVNLADSNSRTIFGFVSASDDVSTTSGWVQATGSCQRVAGPSGSGYYTFKINGGRTF